MSSLAVVADLLAEQDGVVARHQLRVAGLAPHDIRRLVRRRELAPLHPGVYADHTGEPTWQQRSWAAVLSVWPAALTHESALRAHEGPGSRREVPTLQVAVARERHVAGPPGVLVRRRDHLEERVQWHLGPPRYRYEEAAIDVAAAAGTELDALAEIARATQGRRTTAARLAHALAARGRTPQREWLERVLGDVAEGRSSVLEQEFHVRVALPHGLAGAVRQVRDRVGAGVVYRDVEYREEDLGALLVVELDGRLHHDTARARDRDMHRDLVTAVEGRRTVRLSYGLVVERSCETGGHLVSLLRAAGWRGASYPCRPSCPVPAGPGRALGLCGGSVSPDDSDPPQNGGTHPHTMGNQHLAGSWSGVWQAF